MKIAIAVLSSIVLWAGLGQAQDCALISANCSASGTTCCDGDSGAYCGSAHTCCYDAGMDAACSSDDDCCDGALCVNGICGGKMTITAVIDGCKTSVDVLVEKTDYATHDPQDYYVAQVVGPDKNGTVMEVNLDKDEEVQSVVIEGEVVPSVAARRLRNLQTDPVGDACEIIHDLLCEFVFNCPDPTDFICQIINAAVCGDDSSFVDECVSTLSGSGDPHMTGFLGQKFDFSGQDGGWYALVHDESMSMNMRITAPLPEVPAITYITGIGLSLVDAYGAVHTVVVRVDNARQLRAERDCPPGVSPCLADGALTITLDGKDMTAPGEVDLGGGVYVVAANIPGECRPFGFEKYWLEKQRQAEEGNVSASRKLRQSFPMGEWILSDARQTNPTECREYVQRAVTDGTLFDHQSEHTSFQITSPTLSFRINHGKIHQLAMRDPTDQFDLPDHIAYQMNIAFETVNVGTSPQGILGETIHYTYDDEGVPITSGPGCISGEEEDYRVSAALSKGFVRTA